MPLYLTTAGTQTGDSTWRCKECHGWDYDGVLGAYMSGSHFTGVAGVLDDAGDDAQTLHDFLKGMGSEPLHDFSADLTDDDLWDLVAFVKTATINMNTYIDLATKAALGNATNGDPLYVANCSGCHGTDGKQIDFGGGDGVGDLADDNPWETLHKIRWGHPGSSPTMPSQVVNGLTDAQMGDLLAYAQTLPTGVVLPLSYATDIHSIWGARGCTACHGGSGGLDLSGAAGATLTNLMTGGNSGSALDLGTPADSLILTKPLDTGAGGVSHGGGGIFMNTSDTDYQTILTWITQGANP
ncbi:MAG: c-type cytochrome [Planctomycetota bacterium]|jgi:thiosulfate dehydrogenase